MTHSWLDGEQQPLAGLLPAPVAAASEQLAPHMLSLVLTYAPGSALKLLEGSDVASSALLLPTVLSYPGNMQGIR